MKTISKNDLEAYIRANGFQPSQGRIGVDVYRDKPGRRAKRELTVSGGQVHLYDLTRGRKRVESWGLS